MNFATAPSETAVSFDCLIRDYHPPHLKLESEALLSPPDECTSSEIICPRFLIRVYAIGRRLTPASYAFEDLSNSESALEEEHDLISPADLSGGAKCN